MLQCGVQPMSYTNLHFFPRRHYSMSTQYSPRQPPAGPVRGGPGPGSPGATDTVMKRYDNITKSQEDKRLYRYV